MKPLLSVFILCLAIYGAIAVDNTTTNISATAQEEQLFQRFQKKMLQSAREMQKQDPSNSVLHDITNIDTATLHGIFHSMIVDPSFGYEWDEVPAPTLTGSNALSFVNAFVATNGWNMQTNDSIFDSISGNDNEVKSQQIQGLPWTCIHEKEFPAVTHDGILYAFFKGFHHDGHGVAYNPHTNHFAATIDAFKPIGQHWYVWEFDHEFPPELPQPKQYEGSDQLKSSH